MRRAVLKGFLLFILFAVVFPWLPQAQTFSLYGWLIPARLRLPFGENPSQAYNLSLYSFPAMFGTHEVHTKPAKDEFRVFLIGDSSIWGVLLRPEETLSEQLNHRQLFFCGKPAHFYNLGYPTVSLTKDILLMDYADRYQPNAILWFTTLEAFPLEKQLTSPLAANNPSPINRLRETYQLPIAPLSQPDYWQASLFGQRRALADWIRLQLYGVPWATTGIDQVYPTEYPAPQTNFEPDADKFHEMRPPLDTTRLGYEILQAGIKLNSAPVWLINEPILVSQGTNSDVRYNFFYPRWAYDTYRQQMRRQANQAGWAYLDVWNLVPAAEFTNSAIHLTADGEALVADAVLNFFQPDCSQ